MTSVELEGPSRPLQGMFLDKLRVASSTRRYADVPSLQEVAAEPEAIELEAACVYFDVRKSSVIANVVGRQAAARLLGALVQGAALIAEQYGGRVCDMHGDAALIILAGDRRADRAVQVAIRIRRYLVDSLRPTLSQLLRRTNRPRSEELVFDAGIGVDIGRMYVLRVETAGMTGAIWQGRCTNTAAKLANDTGSPCTVIITKEVFDALSPELRVNERAELLWTTEAELRVAGAARRVCSLVDLGPAGPDGCRPL
ncbi:hypothetical protein ACN28C_04880 [Plantactinospora sp. WMMC1484]|uniref:hypothetical protein n=1 Tax=Plantactinospora sp. WMMC1484 TaxID=3404122 RepID=UPI003BF56C64